MPGNIDFVLVPSSQGLAITFTFSCTPSLQEALKGPIGRTKL